MAIDWSNYKTTYTLTSKQLKKVGLTPTGFYLLMPDDPKRPAYIVNEKWEIIRELTFSEAFRL